MIRSRATRTSCRSRNLRCKLYWFPSNKTSSMTWKLLCRWSIIFTLFAVIFEFECENDNHVRALLRGLRYVWRCVYDPCATALNLEQVHSLLVTTVHSSVWLSPGYRQWWNSLSLSLALPLPLSLSLSHTHTHTHTHAHTRTHTHAHSFSLCQSVHARTRVRVCVCTTKLMIFAH